MLIVGLQCLLAGEKKYKTVKMFHIIKINL